MVVCVRVSVCVVCGAVGVDRMCSGGVTYVGGVCVVMAVLVLMRS